MFRLNIAQQIERIQAIIDYTLSDDTKIYEALQAPGSIGSIFGHLPGGNKRLVPVGDAVLRLALVEICYEEEHDRNSTQKLISRVASNANLAAIGRRLHIQDSIKPALGTMAITNGTLADTVKAVIGAVYLDGGLDAASCVLRTLGLLV